MMVYAGGAFHIINNAGDGEFVAFRSGESFFYPIRFVVKKLGRLVLMEKRIDGTVKRCRRNYTPQEFLSHFEILPANHESVKQLREDV